MGAQSKMTGLLFLLTHKDKGKYNEKDNLKPAGNLWMEGTG
jgi:hypothetical protein